MFESEAAFAPFAPHLREIFPEQAPGNLTYRPEIRRWVWTTFHNFQWDLNYANPEVFTAMLGEMLHIANIGVEVLRLDAVAFIWKEPGTTCEGLPQAHTIIRAYNALTRIVAPALLFKSEAIVHPAEVARYIDVEEAPLSYNPTLMALLWESLATRKVDLLRVSMQRRFDLPPRLRVDQLRALPRRHRLDLRRRRRRRHRNQRLRPPPVPEPVLHRRV